MVQGKSKVKAKKWEKHKKYGKKWNEKTQKVYKNDGNNFELRKKLFEKKLHNLCSVQYNTDRDRDIVCTPEQQHQQAQKVYVEKGK